MSRSVDTKPSAALSFTQPFRSVWLLLTSHDYFNAMILLLLLFEVALNFMIINYVPYTEIDWTTYMQQVEIFLGGERNYGLIKGSTGPVVYPAGFLYVYSVLYHLTNKGVDVKGAQYIFAAIYILTMGIVFTIYKRCQSVPPYGLILMTLSKRLHSIYTLRLFNDGVTMLLFYAFVLAWTSKTRHWMIGTILYSIALSIKMNILLTFPALLYILFINLGILKTLFHVFLIVLIQISFAVRFLSHSSEYLNNAFNFSRAFDWTWTVNWRWVGQETFSSEVFSRSLLGLHATGLIILLLLWSHKEGGIFKLIGRGLRRPQSGAALGSVRSSNNQIVKILFSTNLVGMICARSLHYQFFSWYAHQLVFLLWHAPFDIVSRMAILGTIEYCWNVFPSTFNSSFALFLSNLLLFMAVCLDSSEDAERAKIGKKQN